MRTTVILLALLLAGCTKTELVPQLYMPTPPSLLMQPAKELKTIKKEQTNEQSNPRS